VLKRENGKQKIENWNPHARSASETVIRVSEEAGDFGKNASETRR
jgi:hypothetical protein